MSALPTERSKQELRAAALAKRDALTDKQRAKSAQALAKRGLPFEITRGTVVSGYAPIRSEIDPAPLMQKIASLGARLALPVINARGKSLTFRAWSPSDRLMLGPLGIPEPSPAAILVLGIAGLGWHAARRRAPQWHGEDDYRDPRPITGRDRLAHAERYWLSTAIR